MITKYHNHKLQTNPLHRKEEPHNNHETSGRQPNQSNQLPSPIEMIAKLEWTQRNTQQNIEQSRIPTMGATINNEASKWSVHIKSTENSGSRMDNVNDNHE